MSNPAVETIVPALGTGAPARLLLTCEHASEDLPAPWAWSSSDRRLVGSHWSHDPGAADLTRALAARLGCPAVLGTVSRLLIDLNRPLDSETLFRDVADGEPVELNRAVTAQDRERRIDNFWTPYHAELDRQLEHHPHASLFSVHSFTPNYEGQPRSVELGVLFDRDPEHAQALARELSAHGFRTELNVPYSGYDGFTYAVSAAADRHGRRCLEIEVNQALLADPKTTAAVTEALHDALTHCLAAPTQASP